MDLFCSSFFVAAFYFIVTC